LLLNGSERGRRMYTIFCEEAKMEIPVNFPAQSAHCCARLLLVLGVASLCNAGSITYYLNQTIGGLGVTGDIVTDGTIGALAQSDIIGYNLQLSDPGGNPSTWNLSCCNYFPFSGSDLSATATQLLFTFSGTDGGVVNIADPSLDFDVCFSTSGGAFGPASFCEGAGETLTMINTTPGAPVFNFQFASQSGTGVIGTIPSILSLPGGSSSTPVLLTAPVVGEVTGTIGGLGSEDYYTFFWPGGAFSATASIPGASDGASYMFSEGGSLGGCDSANATLNSGDSFTSTIAIASLAPGSYCIGVDANNSNDPAFALTFNTPVYGATPEPATFLLLSIGLGMIGVLRLTKRSQRREKVLLWPTFRSEG